MTELHRHAAPGATWTVTQRARTAAAAARLNPTEADWRDAFLTITASVLGDPSEARWVGAMRDAERWTVRLGPARVDVVYAAETATFVTLLPPAGIAPAHAAPRPRTPTGDHYAARSRYVEA